MKSFPADSFLQAALDKRVAQDALRTLRVHEGLADFCSNDYLGFARSEELFTKTEEELSSLPHFNGSGGSRLLSGNTAYAVELEERIAAFHNAESALIYNSGYDANVGLFSALGQKDTTIIYDELIHASVHDGIRMSAADSYMFRHNDLFHLEERLKIAGGTVYVAVESVYSMDGDQSPLRKVSALCKKYRANLIVDEAHCTGTIGKGFGLVQELKMETAVFARVHTFGKALGCHGAAVTGSRLLRDYLINFSRSFIYTTALPLKSLVAINQAYLHLSANPQLIDLLNNNISLFKSLVHGRVPALQKSDGPVQSLLMPGNGNAKELAQRLQDNGFDVRAILSPTVAKGKERLRICIHSYNTAQELSALCEGIVSFLQNKTSPR
jgi:8-amino-7-oxononanoate synthase